MTRSTNQTPAGEPVELEAESPSPTTQATALRLARAMSLGVARGTGAAARNGGRLLGQGFAAARSGLRRDKPVVAILDESRTAASAGRRRGMRPILLLGALAAAVAAGVAVWKLRRPEPAPVADRPPSLGDFDAPEPVN